MIVIRSAAVQLSPVLYSREGTVEKVIGKIAELGAQGAERLAEMGGLARAADQLRLRWARIAEMVATIASALPPPKGAMLAKPWVSASN
jgi:hypothetical protein